MREGVTDGIIYVDAIGTAETTIMSGVGIPWRDDSCAHLWAQCLGDRYAECMLCGVKKDTDGQEIT